MRRVSIATVQLARFDWSEPFDHQTEIDEVRVDLCLTPRPRDARACFRHSWAPHRFEPIGALFPIPAGQLLHAGGESGRQASISCSLRPERLRDWFDDGLLVTGHGEPIRGAARIRADLAGGTARLAERAQARLNAGEPLEALHLLDVALGAEPGHAAALTVKQAALALLLERSGGTNLGETMWLRSEIRLAGEQLSSAAPAGASA